MMTSMIEMKEIEKLAQLSRITLTEQEKVAFQKEIGSILAYIQQIQKVSGTPKTAEERAMQKEEVRNVLREDTDAHVTGEYTEALLKNVPKRDGQYVKVKKILQ